MKPRFPLLMLLSNRYRFISVAQIVNPKVERHGQGQRMYPQPP